MEELIFKALFFFGCCYVESLYFFQSFHSSAKILSVTGYYSACMANCGSNSAHLQEFRVTGLLQALV